jgi:hypothetical protein
VRALNSGVSQTKTYYEVFMQNNALKIECLDITEKQAHRIESLLRDFASNLGYSQDKISSLECRARDGFSPHSYNMGGIECIMFQDQYSAQINGTGFKNADATLDKYLQYDVEYFCEDNPTLLKDQSNWSESDFEKFDECRREDDQADVLYGCDIMLTSDTSLNIRITVCVKDAPYHRQYDDLISIDIDFKNITDLKRQLKNVLKQDNIKMFSKCLNEAY